VRVGRLHQAGEQGRLGERQLGRLLGEVALTGRRDTVRAGAEVGDVQVAAEDLLLGELLLERDRVPHLLELAAGGVLGGLLALPRGEAGIGLEDVPDVLHRQRRGALLDLAAAAVGDERADHAAHVDAAVLEEAGVLGRHDRLAHDRRHLVERHVLAVDVVEAGDQGLAVVGVEVRALRGRWCLQVAGQVQERVAG
jgi:hypothetical protein